jgi:DNA-directed RNA polymerase subunit RPC12/RpoP
MTENDLRSRLVPAICTQCGAKKPEAVSYRCSKCGFTPENPANPPKFCPECGNRFEEKDIVK